MSANDHSTIPEIDHSLIIEDSKPLASLGAGFVKTAGLVGILALALTFFLSLFLENGLKRFMFSYLTSFSYFLGIALGALFFVMLQHLTRAGWSVTVRRVSEYVAATLPVMAILLVPVILGMGQLYKWTDPAVVAADHLIQVKQPYLNAPFFIARCVFYFGLWLWLSRYFLNKSLEQDQTGDAGLTLGMEKLSAPSMVLFALTITFASIDLIMTLTPHWYSTIFGVYFFAGGFLSFLALLTVLLAGLQWAGRLRASVNGEHFHDIGKLMFGFTVFWAYIAFSQYLLIWYGNIPEETEWYFHRQQSAWTYVGLMLIIGHFLLPFFGLLSRYPKRNAQSLCFWAVWILVMHWVDVYYLVMPTYEHEYLPLHIFDPLCMIGVGGLFIASAAHAAGQRALVPLNDPRLSEALTFQNF